MFELGIHRDPQQLSDLPVYILESRRRLFAAAYQLDKSVATFLGRPPRISWRHSDCSLPLDLADDALVGSPSEVELASTSIDSKGWNMHNVFQRASWIRVRFLISTFREEILELSLQRPTPKMADQLRWAFFLSQSFRNYAHSTLGVSPSEAIKHGIHCQAISVIVQTAGRVGLPFISA